MTTETKEVTWEKLERGGKVAVLYSPGYGAGWFTWNSGMKGLLFDREIVEAIEAGDRDKAKAVAERKYPGGYFGGVHDLEVEWLDKGTVFEVEEYDGSETIHVIGGREYIVA